MAKSQVALVKGEDTQANVTKVFDLMGGVQNVIREGTTVILKPNAGHAEPSKLLVEKMEAGDLGFKTGKEFQEWTEEEIAASRKNLTEGLIKVAKALDRL